MRKVPFLLLIVLCVFMAGCGPSAGGSYTVTGQVFGTIGDEGLEEVTIAFSGGYGTTTTDASGNWSKSGLAGTVTVTPAKEGYTFDPASRRVTDATSYVHFVGFYGVYAVSGRVTCRDNGQGLEGVTIGFNGILIGGPTEVATGADGTWSRNGLWDIVNVTPAKEGWAFDPPSMPVSRVTSNADFIASMVSPITFDDPNLEKAVRTAINKPTGQLMNSDVMNITGLSPGPVGICLLGGIEHLVNLRSLGLSGNRISDISPLAGLTKMESLYLRENWISDISPLAGLTNMKELNLQKNWISDISPLAGLTSMKYLYLDETKVSDISPLAGLTNMKMLNLSYNQISDISPLAGLTNMERLYLYRDRISDISALAGLTNMWELGLNSNQVSDISALAGLTNMKKLHLKSNRISDISALVANSGLGIGDEVYLGFNRLDLSPGSDDMQNIKALRERYVYVEY